MRQSLPVALPRRQLIVNADDLGTCAARDAGILAAFTAGGITSASLLVNGPGAAEAAQQALAAGLPLGLHLNLSEGRPCAAAGTLADSLVDADGSLRGRHGLRAALAAGAIARGDLAREIRTQFDRFIALTGALPGHVDGHQHCHVEAPVSAVLAAIMDEEYGVRRVRLPQEADLAAAAAAGRLVADDDLDLPFQLAVAASTATARDIFAAAGIVSTTAFLGQTLMGRRLQTATVAERLAALAADAGERALSVELMVHPGQPAAAGEGSAFCRAPARAHELALLCSDAWRSATAGWQMLAWPDLRRPDDADPRPRVLIVGKLTPATGNAETARRQAEAWATTALVCRRPLLADPDDDAALARDAAHLRRQAAAEGCDLAFGIHLDRAGSLLAAAFAPADGGPPLPFGLLASGTDVNADLEHPARRARIARNLAAADFLCCVSADLHGRLAASGLALPADRTVIGNGMPPPANGDRRRLAAIRRELGLPAEPPIDERLLILPASLRRLKGVLPLVDALAPLLATRFAAHRLLVLGPTIEADYAQALAARIATLTAATPALRGRIVVHPGLPHADYLALLASAALLLNASDHEGLCHGIGEAMAAGVPVLVRDIAGNRELVRDGGNGRLFADFAALPAAFARAFDDPETTASLAAAAQREIAERFPAAAERAALSALLARTLARRQTVLPFAGRSLRLDRAADTHPVSAENHALLGALALSPAARKRWPQTLPLVADIGCGCGVFGFRLLDAIAADGRRVGRLLFTDPHAASLAALARTLTRHRPQLAMLDAATLDDGSLLAPLLAAGERAQALCCNLPQTPGPTALRLDRCGGADGAELICRLLADLPQALADDGEAFLLHIGLAHPARVARAIADGGFVADTLAEQRRHARFADYEALLPGLADHLRAEQAAARAEFAADADGEGFTFSARLLRLRRPT